MPTLRWLGDDAVKNHHEQVPYRLLRCDGDNSTGAVGDGNLLIEGDNLHALKALLPFYKGKVKCACIDPPYNTGNENWIYNDNVNSPEIRRWINEVVARDNLSRHDRWLCMMYPRLQLLHELLREDGAIFIHIDDNEVAHLRLIMDEIFGEQNFVTTFTWKGRAKPSNTGDAKLKPQNDAEYIVCYKKRDLPRFRLVHSGRRRSYPHKDKDGNYRLQTILKSNRGESKRETMQFSLAGYAPPPTKRWQAGEDTIRDLHRRNRITFQTGEPMLKYYEHEENEEFLPFYCHVSREMSGTAEEGKQILNGILGIEHGFDTVKPLRILKYVLERFVQTDDLVLDSFAGSGTTGHAVLALNKEDGGNRRFILVELEKDVCERITAERLRRVIDGYGETPGLGGGFRYCRLGEPMFDERGDICKAVTFSDLAHHIFFTETGEPLPKPVNGRKPLIGVCRGTAYYLLWDRQNGGHILNPAEARRLPAHDGTKVVFADGCVLSAERRRRLGIVFKQIPYAIRKR